MLLVVIDNYTATFAFYDGRLNMVEKINCGIGNEREKYFYSCLCALRSMLRFDGIQIYFAGSGNTKKEFYEFLKSFGFSLSANFVDVDCGYVNGCLQAIEKIHNEVAIENKY